MTSKKPGPYLALLGQGFDLWGIVEVASDTRSHVAIKDVSPAIAAELAAAGSADGSSIGKSFVLAHTKGFDDLPDGKALELISILRENLEAHNDDMNERLDSAKSDYYVDDPRGLREHARETKKEFAEYWKDELAHFKNELLPQALVDYWEQVRNEARGQAELAERARLRALAKMQGIR